MGLLPYEEARARILADCPPLHPRAVPLADSLGCVTSVPLHADEDVPPFANTAMDGFAVRAADTAGAPVTLKVVATLAAGAAPDREVGSGEAIRIMTGAPMPPGADAVVMVERTRSDDGGLTVVVEQEARPGDHVRLPGGDVTAGQVVFEPFTEVRPAHLGVLASLGMRRVPVFPRVRVGVFSTGDELVEDAAPGELAPGQIRDSNRPMLLALVARSGAAAVDLGHARDDEAAIAEVVTRGAEQCDVLVSSGGVSVGDFDYVKVVLDRLGRMQWWQLAIKPAKPLAFGVVGARSTPVFGLPGNPVSALVSFELFVRPALRQMAGHRGPARFRCEVLGVAGEALPRRPDGKVHFVRVAAAWDDGDGAAGLGRWVLRSAGGQDSHQLRAMAVANALAVVPDGDGVGEGEPVRVVLLDADDALGAGGA